MKYITIGIVLSLIAVTGIASAEGIAPSGTYVNDAAHTRLLWSIRHMGLSNYTARVNDVSITLEYDADDIAASTVRADIDPRSVDTAFPGEKDFNAEISDDPRILNAAEFPSISFVSRRVTATGDNTAAVEGDLTLLGVTRPVTLNATLNGELAEHPFMKVPAIGFTAEASFDRTDFGLEFLSGPILGDQVDIVIQAEFIKQ